MTFSSDDSPCVIDIEEARKYKLIRNLIIDTY
jgi:hypothetical protein